MKISNIIIIAFAIAVLASMLVLFVDAKNHQNYKDPNIEMKSFPLSDFSVVIAEKSSDIHLNPSDTNAIEIEYLKNKVVKNQIYKLQNDTLFVYGGLRTFVKCNKLKSIRANKPLWFGIGNFNLDSLYIDVTGGYFQFNKNDNKLTKIQHCTINATDSARVVVSDTKIGNITLHASVNSNCDFWSECEHVTGELKNKTRAFFKHNPQTIQLKRDKDSSFRIE